MIGSNGPLKRAKYENSVSTEVEHRAVRRRLTDSVYLAIVNQASEESHDGTVKILPEHHQGSPAQEKHGNLSFGIRGRDHRLSARPSFGHSLNLSTSRISICPITTSS